MIDHVSVEKVANRRIWWVLFGKARVGAAGSRADADKLAERLRRRQQ